MLVKMQETLSSIGVKKDLPVTKFLNYELNKLRESGILQNILVNPKENCPLDENPKAITFSKMVFLFAIFVLGGILSILIFILERAFSNEKDATLEKIYGNQRKFTEFKKTYGITDIPADPSSFQTSPSTPSSSPHS